MDDEPGIRSRFSVDELFLYRILVALSVLIESGQVFKRIRPSGRPIENRDQLMAVLIQNFFRLSGSIFRLPVQADRDFRKIFRTDSPPLLLHRNGGQKGIGNGEAVLSIAFHISLFIAVREFGFHHGVFDPFSVCVVLIQIFERINPAVPAVRKGVEDSGNDAGAIQRHRLYRDIVRAQLQRDFPPETVRVFAVRPDLGDRDFRLAGEGVDQIVVSGSFALFISILCLYDIRVCGIFNLRKGFFHPVGIHFPSIRCAQQIGVSVSPGVAGLGYPLKFRSLAFQYIFCYLCPVI